MPKLIKKGDERNMCKIEVKVVTLGEVKGRFFRNTPQLFPAKILILNFVELKNLCQTRKPKANGSVIVNSFGKLDRFIIKSILSDIYKTVWLTKRNEKLNSEKLHLLLSIIKLFTAVLVTVL